MTRQASVSQDEGSSRTPALPEGFDGPRACRPMDLAAAVDLVNHVFRGPPGTTEGPARPPNIGWAYSFVYHPGNLDNLRVVCHQGRVVSLVAIHDTEVRTTRGTIRAGGICGVATHPDYRRLGLSSATLADAHAHLRAGGRHLGLLGTTIHHFYRRLGWERAGPMRTFTLDRRSVELVPAAGDLDIALSWRPHLPALCALHNARVPAAVRSPDLMETLLERRAPQVFAGSRNGRAVAYVALQETTVREHAGAPADVMALLRHAYTALDNPAASTSDRRQRAATEMSVVTPECHDGECLAALLLRYGIPSALGYIGMVRLLDVPGLLAALDLDDELHLELLPASSAGAAGRWRLHYRGRALTLVEGDLAKLLFGPERWPEFAPGLLPVDFFQWPLDRV